MEEVSGEMQKEITHLQGSNNDCPDTLEQLICGSMPSCCLQDNI